MYAVISAGIIEVATDNTAYTSVDGVLFTKDEKILVAFPGGKSSVYTIPRGVTTIGNKAFSNCDNLYVHYLGTEE